jgi:hypothetical protein
VLQDFHAARGFGADTAPAARQLLQATGWGADDYRRVLHNLRTRLPQVYEGESGFYPP